MPPLATLSGSAVAVATLDEFPIQILLFASEVVSSVPDVGNVNVVVPDVVQVTACAPL